MANEKRRNQQYDILRIILTALVVIGHGGYYSIMTRFGGIDIEGLMQAEGVADTTVHRFISLLCGWIYTFHMPAFLALSGCIFSEQLQRNRYADMSGLVRDKLNRLVWPLLFVWFFWNIPVKWISGYYAAQPHPVVSAVVQIIFPVNVYLWYLEALFLCFLLGWILVRKVKGTILQGLMVGVGWCADRVVVHFAGGYCPLGQPLKWFLWFWIGMQLPRAITWMKEKNLWNRGLLMLSITGHTVLYIVSRFVSRRRWVITETVLPLLGILCLWYLSEKMKELLQGRGSRYTYVMAGYTFGIYLWAEPLNYLILFLVYRFGGIQYFGTELGAIEVFVSRIVLTLLIAISISCLLRQLNTSK